MKEIGIKLKAKREESGIGIDEAANDLNIRKSQLESIEEGKKENFKDVLSLKLIIRDYAKYLGLNGEEMLDEFNEYLFEQTSKISLKEIEAAKKEKEEKERDLKILSPYTLTTEDKNKRKIYILIAALLLLLLGIIYIIVSKTTNDDFINDNVSYNIGGIYE